MAFDIDIQHHLITGLPALDQVILPAWTVLRWLVISIGLLWLMFGLYTLVMGLYRVKLAGKLTRVQYVLGFPYYVAGVTLDVALNWSIGSILLWSIPKEAVMTTHMKRLRREAPDSWGGRVSAWICDQGLDSLDPSGDHC